MTPRRVVDDRTKPGAGLLLPALRRWAWVIALCAIVPALIGLVVTINRPKVYEAKARLLAEITATSTSERDAKRGTLVWLVRSETIAEQVFERHAQRLAPEITSAASLQEHVSRALPAASDLLEISVGVYDADMSVTIANEWAELYEDLVSATFAEASAALHLEELNIDLATSKRAYDEAEQAWVDFVSENRLGALDRAIEEKGKVIAGLQEQNVEAGLAELKQLRDDRVRLKRVLADLRALQEHLEKGDAAAAGGATLTLDLLKTEAFASSAAELLWNLQVQLGAPLSAGTSTEVLMGEVLLFGDSLETRIGQLDVQIEEKSAHLMAGSMPASASGSLAQLRDELEQLQAEREMERSRQTGLTAARDLAWQMYQKLALRLAEESLVSEQSATRVRLVTPASAAVPVKRSGPLQTTAVAGAAGLMLGLGVAFVVEYLRWEQRRGRDTSRGPSPGSGEFPGGV